MNEIDLRKLDELYVTVLEMSERSRQLRIDLAYLGSLLGKLERNEIEHYETKLIEIFFESSYQTLHDDALTIRETHSLFRELMGFDSRESTQDEPN